MTIRRLFASLNVMYLKLIQYEKVMHPQLLEPIFEAIDFDLGALKHGYDREHRCSKMTLLEMMSCCEIEKMVCRDGDVGKAGMQLKADLFKINELFCACNIAESENYYLSRKANIRRFMGGV